MFVTDAKGIIQRVNHAFSRTTGYLAEEAVGQTPALLRSGRHDAKFYHDLWMTLRAEGYWQGEVWNRRKNGEIYPEWLTITAVRDKRNEIIHYVAAFSDITKRKADEEEIRRLAFYDPLTRLPNRRLLLDRLALARAKSARNDTHGGLLFIDLDNFKQLNDSLGHDMGDLLLEQVARRLELCVRGGDTVARLGGDEFIVMLENLDAEAGRAREQIGTVGTKILAALAQPFSLRNQSHATSPSIGATLFKGQTLPAEELLKRADHAMYQAKTAGRNTLRFFED